jgi:hypothetical protein
LRISNFWVFFLGVSLFVIGSGCTTEKKESQLVASQIATTSPSATVEICCQSPYKPTAITLVLPQPLGFDFGLTYHQPDGNRLVAGQGDLPNAKILDIPLPDSPVWVVAAPQNFGSLWVAALPDGQVRAFFVDGQHFTPIEILPLQIPPGAPPNLMVSTVTASLMTNSLKPSGVTHPVWNSVAGAQLLFSESGDLLLWKNEIRSSLGVNSLPDGRILLDETGRVLFLTEPTERYDHGVLGDSIEAAGFVLVEIDNGNLRVVTLEAIDPSAVIEGITPIWTDLNGDGTREIIVTESDAQQGARIVVYAESGQQIALGPAIGLGYRWRHQLAVAPFGPNGQVELAVVRTPHIGGLIEFYQMNGTQLEIVATLPGFSTHSIGSRNLDNALAGDFDGDGIIELLLPDQAHENLGAVQRTETAAEVDWWLPMDGKHTSNLAAVTLPSGKIAVGIGTENNVLRLWLPQE